jgi:hypothetical protein
MCKCEMREIGSKDCNAIAAVFGEPSEISSMFLWCAAKSPARGAAMLDRAGPAS